MPTQATRGNGERPTKRQTKKTVAKRGAKNTQGAKKASKKRSAKRAKKASGTDSRSNNQARKGSPGSGQEDLLRAAKKAGEANRLLFLTAWHKFEETTQEAIKRAQGIQKDAEALFEKELRNLDTTKQDVKSHLEKAREHADEQLENARKEIEATGRRIKEAADSLRRRMDGFTGRK